MELNLAGRTALITGGSRGIGFAAARRLAQEGVHLRLAARVPEQLARAEEELRALAPVDIHTYPLDLSLADGRAKLVETVTDIDILVNNAGNIPSGTIEEMDDKAWRDAWELKLFGFIDLTRAYFARMKKKQSGVIINIIGAAGERPDYNYAAGSVANAALIALTHALGGVSPDYQVRVLGINPGAVATERTIEQSKRNALRRYGDANRWQERYAKMPFGRPQTPDQAGALIAFLASDLAGYISGSVITADGGRIYRNEHH
jgi:NAD(P)-dependent dehydrogenase (short-subunit alcohol dehydrogenase family)